MYHSSHNRKVDVYISGAWQSNLVAMHQFADARLAELGDSHAAPVTLRSMLEQEYFSLPTTNPVEKIRVAQAPTSA